MYNIHRTNSETVSPISLINFVSRIVDTTQPHCYNLIRSGRVIYITIRKLAKMINVSPSTVSKALSGSKEISDETIALVRKAAEDTGYIVGQNKRRRSARKPTNPNIAILCPEINGLFYSSFLTLLSEQIEVLGGNAFIHIYGFNPDKQNEMLVRCTKNSYIDGAILVSCACTTIENVDFPIVNVLEISRPSNSIDSVQINLETGISQAIRYLRDIGHKRIGFIGETNTGIKYSIFKSICKSEGIELDESQIIVNNKRFEEAGYDAAEQILKTGNPATAYIAAYDEVAIGAIKYFEANGLKVPEDISIIGINDIATASYLYTPLTTIGNHMEEICKIAISLLMNKITNADYKIVQHIYVDSEFVIRKSTAAPNNKTI